MKMLKCPICGMVKKANRKQVTCSHKCAAELARRVHGRDRYVLLGRAAGRASGRVTTEKARTLWEARFPGVDPALVQDIYTRGQNAGFKRGVAMGRRKAFAEMARDSEIDMRLTGSGRKAS